MNDSYKTIKSVLTRPMNNSEKIHSKNRTLELLVQTSIKATSFKIAVDKTVASIICTML